MLEIYAKVPGSIQLDSRVPTNSIRTGKFREQATYLDGGRELRSLHLTSWNMSYSSPNDIVCVPPLVGPSNDAFEVPHGPKLRWGQLELVD